MVADVHCTGIQTQVHTAVTLENEQQTVTENIRMFIMDLPSMHIALHLANAITNSMLTNGADRSLILRIFLETRCAKFGLMLNGVKMFMT